MPETDWLEALGGDKHGLKGGVVVGFGLGERDVADGLEEASGVEPVDPVQDGEFDGFDAAPGLAMDHLGLEQAVDGLGQDVVIAVADAADGWFDASLGQPLGVANTDVWGEFNWWRRERWAIPRSVTSWR